MRLITGIALGAMFFSGFGSAVMAVEPDAPERLITRLDAASFEVQRRLAKPFRQASAYHKHDHGGLVEYYSEPDSKLLWVDETGLTDRARAVIAELQRADDYGLSAADYKLPEAAPATSDSELSAEALAELELKMSWAALEYARHARGGRIVPSELSGYLDPTLRLPVPRELLDELAGAPDAAAQLRGLHPRSPQFEALRQKLLELRAASGEKRKRVVMPKGPALKVGARHANVALLRERLEVPAEASEDNPDADAELYDAGLAEKVKEYQKSRGLGADGIIGPATRRALNARPRNRVRTILANMERWRWLPDDPGKLSVRVNVPEFMFRVFEDGKAIHTERVVVGKLKNQTPIFSDEMEHIVFNPYWNVPNSIKVAEILPSLTRSGGWFSNGATRALARHNLQVKYRGRVVDPSSVDWSSVDIRRYHIYQPPGGPNVLGVVKFMFPNKHSVYMHDTTSKSLFDRSRRAYSHGCMRVRDPRRFAEVLLSRDSGWSRKRIDQTIATGRNSHVKLKTKVPVHITYFTARVDDNGRLRYFSDIYGHDSRIANALKLPRGS